MYVFSVPLVATSSAGLAGPGAQVLPFTLLPDRLRGSDGNFPEFFVLNYQRYFFSGFSPISGS